MKRTAGILVVVLAAVLGLSGCAASGPSSGGGPASGQFLIMNDQLVAQIKDGVSTKDDVKGLLGNPGAVITKKEAPDMPDDMEGWSYSAVTQMHAHALFVMFKNGIVQSHSKTVAPIAR